jgi:hypothetical protein
MPIQPYFLKDGTKVPGTTTVIGASLGWNKQILMAWANKQGREGNNIRETVQDACDAGTLAHAAAEAHVKGKPAPDVSAYEKAIVKKAKKAYEAFCTWEEMSKLVISGSEIGYVSETLKFGGTLDGEGKINGADALIDFKTSNGTYADHVIQVAAYSYLWEENHPGRQLDGGIHLLRFGKEAGNFTHYYYPRETILAEPFETFQLLRRLYDLKKPVEALT